MFLCKLINVRVREMNNQSFQRSFFQDNLNDTSLGPVAQEPVIFIILTVVFINIFAVSLKCSKRSHVVDSTSLLTSVNHMKRDSGTTVTPCWNNGCKDCCSQQIFLIGSHLSTQNLGR